MDVPILTTVRLPTVPGMVISTTLSLLNDEEPVYSTFVMVASLSVMV